jgi:hypothetical protein
MATAVAAGPNHSLAWADDSTSGELYWEGQYGIGTAQFDGGVGAFQSLTSGSKPTALFAYNGVAYWTLHGMVRASHCRFVDGGCMAADLPSGLSWMNMTGRGIAASSRNVMAVFTPDISMHNSVLVFWRR